MIKVILVDPGWPSRLGTALLEGLSLLCLQNKCCLMLSFSATKLLCSPYSPRPLSTNELRAERSYLVPRSGPQLRLSLHAPASFCSHGSKGTALPSLCGQFHFCDDAVPNGFVLKTPITHLSFILCSAGERFLGVHSAKAALSTS